MSSLLFFVLYTSMLLLPGGLIIGIVRPEVIRFYMLIAYSIAVWAVAMVLTWSINGNEVHLVIIYFTLIGTLFLIRLRVGVKIQQAASQYLLLPGRNQIICVLLVVVFVTYAYFTGPYLELPADNLWHLLVVGNKWEQLVEGKWDIGTSTFGSLLLSRSYYWHNFYAFAAWLTGVSLPSTYNIVWVVNGTFLALGVYSFATYLFEQSFKNIFSMQIAALLATVFFILHTGTSVFSYIRYYVFAPAGLGLLNYFSAITLFMQVINSSTLRLKDLTLAALLLIVATMWHSQEGLFIIVMAVGLLVMRTRRVFQSDWNKFGSIRLFWSAHIWLFSLLILTVLGYLSVHGYLYMHKIRNNPLVYGKMIDAGLILPFLKNLYILNPFDQFYKVLTIWGVTVYVAWHLGRRYFRQQEYLMVGMWLPLFTVFNPIFTDLFLRLSYPEMLWRLGFLIPLPFVAAYLSVVLFQEARECGTSFWMVSAWKWSLWGGFIILLVILLGPIHSRFIDSSYSKYPMLSKVNPKADYHQWSDVLQQLDRYPGVEVLTDQITGYLVNAHTHAHYRGHKFLGLYVLSTRNRSYKAADLQPFAGGLLLINLRDGSASEIGRIGRHWPENVRKMQQWYSPAFLQLLDRCPDTFTLIWQAEKVSLYRISTEIRCDKL